MSFDYKLDIYGDFDFVEEFRKLDKLTPKCGSWTRASENCSYGDINTVSKNCYMCFNTGNSQNAYYADSSRKLTDCTDCSYCEGCELCYECVDCDTCYSCNYSQDCSNCENVHFSYDLRRCKDCFGCVALRDKQYCIFNKQHSKEEYEKMIVKFNHQDAGQRKYVDQELERIRKETPRLYSHQHDTENCTGDYIYHSKNCYMCFDTRHSEDSLYIYQANLDMGTRDCIDCGPIPTGMDISYDVSYSHYLFNCKHLYWCGNLKDSQYCTNCLESRNLFGCNYMQKKENGFYILNQKVDEAFYNKKTAEIRADLKERGVYTFYDLLYKDLSAASPKVADEELKRGCKLCGDVFEILPEEIKFYKKFDITYPIYCPDCRANQRRDLRGQKKMYKRKCDRCKSVLVSTFEPKSEYTVYCLDCYWAEIG